MHNRNSGRLGFYSEIVYTNEIASRITEEIAELFAGDAFMEFRMERHSIKGLVYLS
jgi:hypothetical protein